MSYHDPNRNDEGQFHSLGIPGATTGEQWSAGVTPYDDAFTAGLRVRNRRLMLGLDEFNGQPAASPRYGSGGYAPARSSAPVDHSWIGIFLVGAMKWLFVWPLLILALAVSILTAAAGANNRWRDSGAERGLAQIAFRSVAPGARLAPPSTYASPKQMASAMRLGALLESGPLATATRRELLSAYLCQTNSECALESEARSGIFVSTRAVLFLIGEAKRGVASAGRDACLLPFLTGLRGQPVLMARRSCAAVAREANTEASRRISTDLDSSGVVAAARILEWISDAACLDPSGPSCRTSDAPAKLASAMGWKVGG